MSNDNGQYGGQQPGGPQYPQGPQQPYAGPQYPAQQYPQYAQYQQQYPQGPGGPQWQPQQPPRKSRTGLIVALSVVGVLVLVVAGLYVVGRTSEKKTATGSNLPAASNGATTPAPSVKPTTGPVSCGEGAVFECFPVATVASVSKALTAKGAKCFKSKEDHDFKCVKGSLASHIDIRLEPALNDATKIGNFSVSTSSHVAGANATGRALVIANLKKSMPTMMAAVLPNEPKTRQDVTAWLNKFTETCPPEAVTLDGYKVDCDPPTKYEVTDKDKLFTTYTFGLSIDAATAFMPSSPR